MRITACAIGAVLIIITLWDAFETVVLPRRVIRRFRLVRFFYRFSWPLWARAVRALFRYKTRKTSLPFTALFP